MFPRAIRLARFGGIDVRLDRSWLVIAVLIVLSFQSRWSASFGTGPALVMAAVGSLLFFASLLLHEMGHAVEAKHRDIGVKGVTLFVLGGVTEMESDAKRPRDEFVIAAVGPFLSLVAGATFGLLATGFDLFFDVPEAEHVLGLLGWLNVGLALFNLVPASPLDGGRILRAAIWAATGDRRRAIALSARSGQLLALLVMVLVVRGLVVGDVMQAAVNLLVAWFLWSAAGAELRHVALDRLLDGARAGGLQIESGDEVDAGASVATLAEDLPAERAVGARPVLDDGEVVGALVLQDVLDLHPQDRVFRVARDLMRPAAGLPRITRDTAVWDLLEVFQRVPLVLLDLDDGRTTTVTARQFATAVEHLRLERRGQPPAPVAS